MLAEPVHDRLHRPIWEEIEHPMAFEVYEDCAVVEATSPRPLVNPNDARRV
jgi:hypothetical protein